VGALRIETWYWHRVGGSQHLTQAGWWYILVSLPIFQFVLYRWYWRLWIWARFLSQVAGAGIDLIPTHPDRCGGLGFLDEFTWALAPLLLAHGALCAGVIFAGILFEGKTLFNYWPAIITLAALVPILAVAPLLVFVPTLLRTRRAGLTEYGVMAQRYVRDFDRKWVHTDRPPDEPLLGSADIQSLADISNSYQVVAQMRLLPLSREQALKLIIVTLLPIAPLCLTMISARELATLLLKGLF